MAKSDWIVLSRQPIREEDWLLEIFSRQQGRIFVIVNRRHCQTAPDILGIYHSEIVTTSDGSGFNYRIHLLETVQPWQSLGCLNLKQDEATATVSDGDLSADSVSFDYYSTNCGLYVVELIQRLLPSGVPQPDLYEVTQAVLIGIGQPGLNEPWLRLLEYQLLLHCGQGFSWHLDGFGQSIHPQQKYLFQVGQGFIPAVEGQMVMTPEILPKLIITGSELLAISEQKFTEQRLILAKRILRFAIECQLQAPLISRLLWL